MRVYRLIDDGTVDDNDVVEIGCKIHGRFFVKAAEHLEGRGCTICDYLDAETKV